MWLHATIAGPRGDPVQVLVVQTEPPEERRQEHRLRDVVPGFRCGPLVGGREGTAALG